MRSLPLSLLAAALLAALPCCKRSADPVPTGESSRPAASTDDHHHHALNLPPVGPSVKISLDGKSADVALSSLPAEGGSIAFVQLWKAAWPAEDPSKLRFELVGSDGFRPTLRQKCTRPLTGAELASARLVVATHDLVLDEAQELPGCYRVRAVVSVEATR